MPTVTGTSSGGGIKKIQRGQVGINGSNIVVPIDTVNTDKCQVRFWIGLLNTQTQYEGMNRYILQSNQLTVEDDLYLIVEETVSNKAIAGQDKRITWEIVEYV